MRLCQRLCSSYSNILFNNSNSKNANKKLFGYAKALPDSNEKVHLYFHQFKRTLFEEKFNTDESDKILKILNESSKPDDFRRYIISVKRIDELFKLREEKGKFTNLDDLIPIMGVKVLEKLYNSMLEKKSLGLGNPITNLPQDKITSYKTVLSVNITGNRLSWSLIKREPGPNGPDSFTLRLSEFNVKEFELAPKTHFLSVLSQMGELSHQLPQCDLCICEEYPSQMPSTYMFSFYLQMTQARSILLGILSAKYNAPQIISIKTVAVARLFNTFIGSEKVSGQHVVDGILESHEHPTILINPSMKFHYLNSDSQTKEYLSNVFLVNLAYWKLTSQFE